MDLLGDLLDKNIKVDSAAVRGIHCCLTRWYGIIIEETHGASESGQLDGCRILLIG